MLPKIHIIGVGNIGKFLAFSLARAKTADVSLLFHRPDLREQFDEVKNTITLIPNEPPNEPLKVSGFACEKAYRLRSYESEIQHLIVASKAHQAAEALQPLVHRMTNRTQVLLIQNGGFGVVQECLRNFRDITRRLRTLGMDRVYPRFYAGVITHGVNSSADDGPWTVRHAGVGEIHIGQVRDPNRPETQPPGGGGLIIPQNDVFFQALRKTENLKCITHSVDKIGSLLLQKLAVNVVINPLTALFNVCNGAVADPERHANIVKLRTTLIKELSPLLLWIWKVGKIKGDSSVLSVDGITKNVLQVAQATANNISSMCQDLRNHKTTEIEYLNGYLHNQALDAGLSCPLNYKLYDLIKRREADFLRPGDPLQYSSRKHLQVLEDDDSNETQKHWVGRMRTARKRLNESITHHDRLDHARRKVTWIATQNWPVSALESDPNFSNHTISEMELLIKDDLRKAGIKSLMFIKEMVRRCSSWQYDEWQKKFQQLRELMKSSSTTAAPEQQGSLSLDGPQRYYGKRAEVSRLRSYVPILFSKKARASQMQPCKNIDNKIPNQQDTDIPRQARKRELA